MGVDEIFINKIYSLYENTDSKITLLTKSKTELDYNYNLSFKPQLPVQLIRINEFIISILELQF